MLHGIERGDPVRSTGTAEILMDGLIHMILIVAIAVPIVQTYRRATGSRPSRPAPRSPKPFEPAPRTAPPITRRHAAAEAADQSNYPLPPRPDDACAAMNAAMNGPGICTPGDLSFRSLADRHFSACVAT